MSGENQCAQWEDVRTATQDREGGLWLASRARGLARWTGYGAWQHWGRRNGLESESVYPPPGFLRWWAIAAAGLLALGFAYALFRWRVRRLVRRQTWLETEVAARTRELMESRDRAEVISKAQGHLITNLSHELRTSLNGILGMTEVILAGNPDPESREALDIIRASAKSMATVVTDILDESALSAGVVRIEQVSFQLQEILNGALDPLQAAARQKGLDLSCSVDEAVPAALIGDPFRLRQVLANLAGNAVKFTEQGAVSVRVWKGEEDPDGRIFLWFEVADTGIGIAAELLRKIFEPFLQADVSLARRYHGLGLGLSISKALVEMMGGRLTVDSIPDKGSRFRFNLPTRAAGEEGMSRAAAK
ncbi:MAG: hypothetical protein FJW20_07075 [Acidimicrobiia bacterium]|nr:hypothetical protein [Acidimicrobiia bacterium]